jgi:hypothetical protein
VLSLDNSGIKLPEGTGLKIDAFIGTIKYQSIKKIYDWIEDQNLNVNIQDIIIDSLMIKRNNFKHESEIRVIYYADESDSKIKPDFIIPFVGFKINPSELIDEISFDQGRMNLF